MVCDPQQVTQQRQAQRTFDSATIEADIKLAERLDRLSAPLAENVLRRAIEIHQEDEIQQEQAIEDGSVSFAELAKIAGEIGIDASTLQRALLEQLDPEKDDSRTFRDLVLGPKRVAGGKLAEGDAEAVEVRVDEWMRELESMYPTRQSGTSTTWESVGGTGALTQALGSVSQRSLESRQTTLASGDQLVELEVDLAKNRLAWSGLGLLLAALGAVTGGFTAANEGFSSNLVEFLIPFGVGSGVGLVTASVGARMTAAYVRRQINRTLDGIANLATRDG